MDTVLCLDSSSSMSGRSLNELKSAVTLYIDYAERIGLSERISVVEFGGSCRKLTGLTADYSKVRLSAKSISASGTTPMAQGLLFAFKEIAENGRITTLADSVSLMPRIIMMTDGAPNSKDEVMKVVALLAQAHIPVACVGVTGCDRQLLAGIAQVTDGMFTMADHIQDLSTFFLRQVVLTMFVVQFARDVAQLYSLEALRQFMYEKTGQHLSDRELQALLLLIQSMTRSQKSPVTKSQKPHPQKSPVTKSQKPHPKHKRGIWSYLIWILVLGVIFWFLGRYWGWF